MSYCKNNSNNSILFLLSNLHSRLSSYIILRGGFFSDDNIYEDYTGAIRRPEKSSKYTSQKKYQQTIKRQIIFITPRLNLSVNMLQPIIVMSLNKYEYILCLRKVGQNVLDQRTETKIMIAI